MNPWEREWNVESDTQSAPAPWERDFAGSAPTTAAEHVSQLREQTLANLNKPATGFQRQAALSVRAPIDAFAPGVSDFFGMPQPQTDLEKFSNEFAKGGYRAAASAGLAGLSKPVSSFGQYIKDIMSSNVGAQISSAGAGAGAAELARQKGFNTYGQMGAGLLAGPIGGGVYNRTANLTQQLARGGLNRLSGGATSAADEVVDRVVSRMGVDPKSIASDVRAALQQYADDAMQAGQPVDDIQMQRFLALRGIGVSTPTRGMVSRDPLVWANEQEAMKFPEGGRLRQIYDDAGQRIVGAIDDTVPGPKGTVETTGRTVREGLQAVERSLKKTTDAAYAAARQSPELKAGVPVGDLRRWLESQNNITQGNGGDGLIYQRALRMLSEFAKDKPKVTVEQFERLRQSVNQWVNQSDDLSVRAGTVVKQQIDDTLLNAGKSEVFRDARFASAIQKSTIDDQRIIKSLLDMASGTDLKVAAEDVFRRAVLTGSTDQLKQIRNTLTMGSQTKAWNAIRKQTVDHLVNKLRPEGTDSRLSPAMFTKEFDAMMNDGKLAVLFSGDELQRLQMARNAVQSVLTSPVNSPVNRSNTASMAVKILQAILKTGPGRVVNTMALNLPSALSGASQSGARVREIEQYLTPLSVQATQQSSPWLNAGVPAGVASGLLGVPEWLDTDQQESLASPGLR